jgi:hypothetical protein
MQLYLDEISRNVAAGTASTTLRNSMMIPSAADRGARFFSGEVRKMSAPDRRARLDRGHKPLSVRRQCALLGLARSGVYRSAPARKDDAAAMRQIDALYTDHTFYGSRRIAFELKMSRKRVQRLKRLMGVAALGPKPRTSKPAPGHKIFPYLLRGVSIERPNQVWACDITYVPILESGPRTIGGIRLFDSDEFLTHNAFRAPGAPSLEELREAPKKVDYLKRICSRMHRNIVAHDVELGVDNLHLLDGVILADQNVT